MFTSIDLLSVLVIFYNISIETYNLYIVFIFTVSNKVFKMAAKSHFVPKKFKCQYLPYSLTDLNKIHAKMFALIRYSLLNVLLLTIAFSFN